MNFRIEFEQEDDGRWIAEIPQLPGVMVYGDTKAEAKSKVETLAFRVVADQIERDGTQRITSHSKKRLLEPLAQRQG